MFYMSLHVPLFYCPNSYHLNVTNWIYPFATSVQCYSLKDEKIIFDHSLNSSKWRSKASAIALKMGHCCQKKSIFVTHKNMDAFSGCVAYVEAIDKCFVQFPSLYSILSRMIEYHIIRNTILRKEYFFLKFNLWSHLLNINLCFKL